MSYFEAFLVLSTDDSYVGDTVPVARVEVGLELEDEAAEFCGCVWVCVWACVGD